MVRVIMADQIYSKCLVLSEMSFGESLYSILVQVCYLAIGLVEHGLD